MSDWRWRMMEMEWHMSFLKEWEGSWLKHWWK